MAISYVWKIDALDCKTSECDLTDVIITSHYRITAVDGNYSASAYSTVQMHEPDPNNFIPFEEITQEQAIQWTKDALGAETVAAYEASLEKQIAEQKAPTITTKVPSSWSAPIEPIVEPTVPEIDMVPPPVIPEVPVPEEVVAPVVEPTVEPVVEPAVEPVAEPSV